LGTRLASWVFVAAHLLGDLGLAICDSSLSLESQSIVSVRVLGECKDQKRRTVAIIGAVRTSEAQISLRSSSPCFFFFVVVNLVDGIHSLTCDADCSVLCLPRSTKIDYAQCVDAYDSGWVFNVSNSDLFESISCIMKWIISTLHV